MRRYLWLLVLVFGNVWAVENMHSYPMTDVKTDIKQQVKELKYPGYCEIEIVNNSNYTVRVYGLFDDGQELTPFRIYPHEYPHYISLYYYGYCHYGMDLYVETLGGYRVYSAYTRRYDTVYITSYMFANNAEASLKVDVKSKSAKKVSGN